MYWWWIFVTIDTDQRMMIPHNFCCHRYCIYSDITISAVAMDMYLPFSLPWIQFGYNSSSLNGDTASSVAMDTKQLLWHHHVRCYRYRRYLLFLAVMVAGLGPSPFSRLMLSIWKRLSIKPTNSHPPCCTSSNPSFCLQSLLLCSVNHI